jgi:hypothetical protein
MGKQLLLSVALGIASITPAAVADDLTKNFTEPPQSARPWVYWFWLNGNITRSGITADLEAMQRVGIGGVLIMEVDQGTPVGPVSFMSPSWRDLFRHAVTEARRLGLEVNMNNDAGWNGSGGPWIKPEQSMEELVWTETDVTGPRKFEGTLARPQATANYFRDVAVLAVPNTGDERLLDFEAKAAYQRRASRKPAAPKQPARVAAAIDQRRVFDLSGRMDESGRLTWDIPPGKWTVLRIGHTSTGVLNLPSPVSGRGLECDKLSTVGIEANFAGMMAKLVEDGGPTARNALVATHIDSWENGSQNWTASMRAEFQKRRGYDILPFLPVMTGRVVGSAEISDRFLWDLRRTVSELVIENYAEHMNRLAHEHGLRFTIEAYGSPCDFLPYGAQADEPMGEFWVGGGTIETCKGMASAGHTYGKPIIGAEAFTADHHERWTQHPASLKALGDRAFCEGINRFVIHRYALQPWADARPGMTMGPWGVHYERTQTWWDWTKPWHDYLARCQYLLRQGHYVADICYLQAESPPQGFHDHPRNGYGWDECSTDVVINRMSVRDGRLLLPDGMSYRLLVLPESSAMTPALLRRIKALVEAGATVVGTRPIRSPSLSGYPACDQEVKSLADSLWGDCDGQSVPEHRVGQGRVCCCGTPEAILAREGLKPDFTSRSSLHHIHRRQGGNDLYFVANPLPMSQDVVCEFRVTGKQPELWWPETGEIEPAAIFAEQAGTTSVSIPLGPSGSVFVVFREPAGAVASVTRLSRDGKFVHAAAGSEHRPRIVVRRAIYGVMNDPKRRRDVTVKVQQLIDAGKDRFQVARMAEGDDPAFGVVKTLSIEYSGDELHGTVFGTDPETILLPVPPAAERVAEIRRDADGHLVLEAWKAGEYELQTASGTRQIRLSSLPSPVDIAGPWSIEFPPGWGAPPKLTLDMLASWSEHPDPGVRFFSGTATYRIELDVPVDMVAPTRRLWLELGNVAVMASVKLNGSDLGVLWKPPFLVDISDAAKPGTNSLEVKVVNLWINRMIGDEQLPEDSLRNENGTLKEWPRWLDEGKPSPVGRYTFTSWRLWKKGDALVPSGLLGPVRLLASERVRVP